MNDDKLAIAERILVEWDHALEHNDVDKLMALYAPDATIESPLVAHLLNQESGICHGTQELKTLLEILAKRKPIIRKYYKNRYFTDGKTLMWEYPRLTPNGEQMDFVEVMELENSLIKYHRVYWGWYGCHVIKQDKYHR